MSMMRASGAMLTITALQMATASLAAPKSVMKTIVGCGAVAAALPFGLPPNFPHEAFVSAIVARAVASKKRRRGMGRVPLEKKRWNFAERIQYTGGGWKGEGAFGIRRSKRRQQSRGKDLPAPFVWGVSSVGRGASRRR